MPDDHIDRRFYDMIEPQIYRRIDNALGKYLSAAPENDISDSAVVFVLRKLWVEPDRYAARLEALGLEAPPEPPEGPPAPS